MHYPGIVSSSHKGGRFGTVLSIPVIAVAVFGVWRAIETGHVAKNQGRPPTVVFVVMDTVRADRTSLCGYEHPTTPALEALARGGATYACNSHAPSTWTLPSHASFFTGRDPIEHLSGSGGGKQSMSWGGVTPLDDRWPTLAEDMSARGYQTLLLSGNPVVAERMGLTRGFDHVAVARAYPDMHDGRLAARLERLLEEAELDPQLPLFAFINIADPHSPWTAIPEGVSFLPVRKPLAPQPGRQRYESGAMEEGEDIRWLSHLSDVYDFSILRADRSLLRVLDLLRERGWLDEDYRLVITSDHGEYLGEHQMVEHGRPYFYEAVTRVPLLYFSSEGHVELPDDAPAVVAHALARDGVVPDPLPPKRASTFRRGPEPPEPAPPCWNSAAAIWKGDSKLMANRGELVRFDLRSDPDEVRPMPADGLPATAELVRYCRALDRAYASRPKTNEEIPRQVAAQLKVLGYLDDDEDGSPSGNSMVP
jgi:arylsulfatase A-like enzyme